MLSEDCVQELQSMLEEQKDAIKEELRAEFRYDMERFAHDIAVKVSDEIGKSVSRAVSLQIFGTETPTDQDRRAFQSNVYFGTALRRRLGDASLVAGGVVMILVMLSVAQDFLQWVGSLVGK